MSENWLMRKMSEDRCKNVSEFCRYKLTEMTEKMSEF